MCPEYSRYDRGHQVIENSPPMFALDL
jgi:hypothetical protein